MKVKALVSFTGTDGEGVPFSAVAGDEFALPKGVDWLKAGLVEAVKEEPTTKRRTATRKPKETPEGE